MKYTTTTTTTTILVSYLAACAKAWQKRDLTVDEASWTPAKETLYTTPVAGFALRPIPAQRVPRRVGLRVAAARDKDDDDDDDDDDKTVGKLTRGTVTSGTVSGSMVTSAPGTNPSNTCGWDKNGGGFFACSDSKAACVFTTGAASCCPPSGRCSTLPRQCVEKKCDSDSDGNTLCCHATAAPHCYTWLMTTSTSGRQETYSLLGCTDKAGVGTLLPTDPASPNSSSDSGSGGGGHSSNAGAIAGGVIGGLAALGLIALLLLYIKKQRKRGADEGKRGLEEQQRKDADDMDFRRDLLEHHKEEQGGIAAAQGTTGAAAAAAAAAATQDRNSLGTRSQSYSPGTERSLSNVSPNGQLSYSVSGVSELTTGGHASNPSPVQPPLGGVVEAPDTRIDDDGSAALVEVAGTKITRESMQTRYELA